MRKLIYCEKNLAKIMTYKQSTSKGLMLNRKDKSKPIEILSISTCDIEELPKNIQPNDIVSIVFEANVYIDEGVFTSLSKLATYISIRNSVNSLGAFGEEFEVSFKKLSQIDKTKAQFFYVACAKESFTCVNSLNCVIDKIIPSDVSIANLFSNYHNREQSFLVVLERQDAIKIICFDKNSLFATKKIAKEGFDTELDETISTVESLSRQYNIKSIYTNLKQDSFNFSNIEIKAINITIGNLDSQVLLENLELLGLLYKSEINFLNQKQKDTLLVFRHAQITKTIAFFVIFLSLVLFGISSANYFKLLQEKENLKILTTSYEQKLKSINLPAKFVQNATDLAQNINLYNQLANSERISTLLEKIASQKLPNLYLLGMKFTNIANKSTSNKIQDATQNQTLQAPYYVIDARGVIFGGLNDTKNTYSNFLSTLSKNFKIDLANIYYLENKLFFDLKIEAKNGPSQK